MDAVLGSAGARHRVARAVSTVELHHVAKRFGNTAVVHDVSLTVEQGELVALLGPSGSGKTTLLRLIAGFESVDAGQIFIEDRDVTADSALDRRCGMVFQHYALFPHLSVGANVSYGLARERLDRAATAARVREALALVDLPGLEDRAVAALSGGQQQRVALARALAPRPAVLLLDEPLSNLDPTLRDRTRRELRDLVRRIGITTVMVTHEQEEAFELADRVALLLDGRLAQVATPEVLYRAPASPAVARFVGRSSLTIGQATAREGDHLVVDALGIQWRATGATDLRGTVSLILRPEAWRIDPTGRVSGTVTSRRFAGAITFLHVRAGTDEFEVAASSDVGHVGDEIRLSPSGTGAYAWSHST